jgi:hypothetical protein
VYHSTPKRVVEDRSNDRYSQVEAAVKEMSTREKVALRSWTDALSDYTSNRVL